MKAITRKALLTLSGALVTVSNALGAAESINPVSHLGMFSDISGDFLDLVFWAAVFIAIVSLLVLWIMSNVSRHNKNVEEHVRNEKAKKGWAIDLIFVLLGLILLLKYIVPKLTALIGVN